MPWRDDGASILDIVIAARDIAGFIAALDLPTFTTDLKTQAAVLHRLIVLGEAAKRLSPEFRAQHPQIPFTKAARNRDFLIHVYDQVSLARVWETASVHVPLLLAAIEPLLPSDET